MEKTTRYLALALLLVTCLVTGLSFTLYRQTRENAFAVLADQGRNLADSIAGSTLFGLASLGFQQNMFQEGLFSEGERLAEKIARDPGDADRLVRELGERANLDAVLLINRHLDLMASYAVPEPNPGLRHGDGRRMGPPGPMCAPPGPGMGMRREALAAFLDSAETRTVLTPRGFSACRDPFRVTVALKTPNHDLLLLSGRPLPQSPNSEGPDLATLFQTIALSPDIVFVALMDGHGDVLARAGQSSENDLREGPVPPEAGFIRIVRDFTEASGDNARLILGISTRKTEETIAQARRNIAWFAGMAWLLGFLGMLVIFGLVKTSARRLAALEEQAAKAERLAALGRMAATVAHEVRNPLSAISVAAGRLNRELGSPDEAQARLLTLIREEIGRLNGIVEGFLSLSRTQDCKREEADLADIVLSVAALYENEAGEKGVRLAVQGPKSACPSLVDRDKVRQALGNILKNAIQASPEGGVIKISISCTTAECAISVEDSGPGISPSDMPRIFEPFFTTRARGSGLGLALAQAVAREHGGGIKAENRPEGGARFVFSVSRQAVGNGR
ncbi:MAG: ATP-binding protein [Thermodesulfobacteriota bacterium]